MFTSALVKLTAFYFFVLLIVCCIFSLTTFAIASHRIEKGAHNQREIFRDIGVFPPANGDPRRDIDEQIRQQTRNDRNELARAIVIANIGILGLGTVACYLFARRTLEPIEQAHEAQSRFTADASHELRTPLAVMKTEIEVALKQNLKKDDLTQVLTSNLEEIERLNQLSNQLLALTRTEHNEQMSALDLSELVTNEVENQSKKYGITISQSIAPGITIRGIETLFRDVLSILISNAVQYAGESSPVITVSLTRNPSNIALSVHDNGIGIPDDDIPHIFNRFYRGEKGHKHYSHGHGLGLSLAHDIVRKHSGSISAESNEKGTTFTVILPK